MARRVFFSFHYARDVMRVMQVRNSWVARASAEATPFYDAAAFEDAKRRAGGIQNWIEEQLKGSSVTVVLFGTETHTREWVLHEIRRSVELKKGLLAVDIHNVRDPRTGTDVAGPNPLSRVISSNGTTLDRLYPTYDWVSGNGYQNLSAWVEAAAQAAGR